MIHFIVLFISLLGAFIDPATNPAVSADDQKRANELMEDGWKHFQKQEMDQAADLFQQAIDIDASNSNAWNGLGWAKFNSGTATDQAEEAFKRAVEIEPTHAAALNGLGQIYLRQGKLDVAEQWFVKASPTASAAWYGLVQIYLLQGKWDDAQKWCQKLIDSKQYDNDPTVTRMLDAAKKKELDDDLRHTISPTNVTPAQQLATQAMQLWQQGKMTEARAQLEQALNDAPDDATVLTCVGWYRLNGERNPGEAEAMFRKVLEKAPSDVSAQIGVASCLKMQGKTDDAIAMFKKVVDQYPQGMNAAYSLADAYMEQEKFEQAVPILEKLAKEWPDNAAIQTALAKAREGAKGK